MPDVMGFMIVGAVGAFPPFSCSRLQNRVVMSMQPRPWPEVPAVTARVVKLAFPEGALAVRVRDQLGCWYEDAGFAGAYGVRGKPGLSPAQLAMVTVLQFAEDMTDRRAADAVRGRMDWKYCLGLELEDAGFDFAALARFRDRLLAGGLEHEIFRCLLELVKGLGLVKAGGRQRTDSTHVLGRIRHGGDRLQRRADTLPGQLQPVQVPPLPGGTPSPPPRRPGPSSRMPRHHPARSCHRRGRR
jgi:transposase